MKTLTTLTAVAALVAGIAVANAQMKPSTSGPAAAPKATGNSPFCISTSVGGALNCKYTSMDACQKDAKPQNMNCLPNPNKGTTGSKQ